MIPHLQLWYQLFGITVYFPPISSLKLVSQSPSTNDYLVVSSLRTVSFTFVCPLTVSRAMPCMGTVLNMCLSNEYIHEAGLEET